MSLIQKSNAVVTLQDEVICIISGISDIHHNVFYERYGVMAPGAFFHPLFKLRRWDGKVRFYSKTGKTYVSLMDEIIPSLKQMGYKVVVNDQRPVCPYVPDLVTADYFPSITLRDYQVDYINAMIEYPSGIGIAGTGAGKTFMCAVLLDAYHKAGVQKTITIVPDRSLILQTRTEFIGLGLDTGEFSGTCKDLDHTHIVSTWQTVKNAPQVMRQFQMVLVDECHGAKGNVLSKILNEYGQSIAVRYGVTGTLPKEPADSLAVRVALGAVRYTIPAHKLISAGWLSAVSIDMYRCEIDLDEAYQRYISDLEDMNMAAMENGQVTTEVPTYDNFIKAHLPDFGSERTFLETHPARLEWLMSTINEINQQPKGNVLVLVNSIRFGKKLRSMLPNSIFLSGDDDPKVRKAVYDRYDSEDHVLTIATAQIASTGLNIPRIHYMVLIDIGKSFIKVIQSIGRGIRKAHDKDSVTVVDIYANLKYSIRHAAERKKYYREAKYPFVAHRAKINNDKIRGLINANH